MTLLDEALELAAAGWAILPLDGKTAFTKHGFHDASTDETQLREWWRRCPQANIGIAVPPGMVVIDIDPEKGGVQTLADFERSHGALPRTQTTITGTGGRHLWFKRATDGLLQRDLGPGLQTRVGGKGYVVAPPSIHPQTGQPYQWESPLRPVAWLPEWVTAKLRPASRKVYGTTYTVVDGQGHGFLEWAAERVRNAPEGQRHETLRNTARLAGGYVAAGLVSEPDVRRVLSQACSQWGTQRKDEATIDSALENGREEPVR